MMRNKRVDKRAKSPIVEQSVSDKTPSDGAGHTDRGLTGHDDLGNMAADSNTNLAPTSRQLRPPAVGDSASREVRYCPPEQDTVTRFTQAVVTHFTSEFDAEIWQGFHQFMDVVVSIQTKAANEGGHDG